MLKNDKTIRIIILSTLIIIFFKSNHIHEKIDINEATKLEKEAIL